MVSPADSGKLNVALDVAASTNVQDGSCGALNVCSEDFENPGRNLGMRRHMASVGEVATVLVFLYLCAGELLPAIFWRGKEVPKPWVFSWIVRHGRYSNQCCWRSYPA